MATRPCYTIHFLHIVLSYIFLYDLVLSYTLHLCFHILRFMYCSFHILFSCYTFPSSLSYLYYRILSCYMCSSCIFHILLSCTIHILLIHLHVLILSIIYFVLLYTFCTFLVFIYLFLYQVILYFLFLSLSVLSSHSKAMLLISYHIIYFSYAFPLCILFLFLLYSCLQIP